MPTTLLSRDGLLILETGSATLQTRAGALVKETAGGSSATAPGATLTGSGTMTAGSATGGGGGNATAPGATLTGTGTMTAGAPSAGSAASGATLTGTGTMTPGAATAGVTFATSPAINNTETLRLAESVNWWWFPAATVGGTPVTPIAGSGTTHATTGVLTLTGITAGAGFVLMRFADGGIAYEEGTAA